MIKFIREMFPPNAWKFEVKMHMEMPLQLHIPTKCCAVYALFYRWDSTAYLHAGPS